MNTRPVFLSALIVTVALTFGLLAANAAQAQSAVTGTAAQDPAIPALQKAVADLDARLKVCEAGGCAALPPPVKGFPVLLSVDPRKALNAQTPQIGLEAYGTAGTVASAGAVAFPNATNPRVYVTDRLFRIQQQANDPKTASGSRSEFSFYNPPEGRPARDAIYLSGCWIRFDTWGATETIFMQIHSTGAAPNPPFALSIRNGQFDIDARYSTTDPTSQINIRANKALGAMVLGRAYYVEVAYKLSATAGLFRIYIDGALVDSYDGPFGYVKGFHYRKQGLYDFATAPTSHAIVTTGPRDVIVANTADIEAARAAVKADRDAVWSQ